MRWEGVSHGMHSHISPFREERGSVTGWYGLLSDIDDQRAAEESFRRSEQELRLIFETMPAMVYTMDPEGDLELVNERLLAFLGATSLAFNEWSDFIHPDDCARVLAVWQSMTAASQPYDIELRLRRSDG